MLFAMSRPQPEKSESIEPELEVVENGYRSLDYEKTVCSDAPEEPRQADVEEPNIEAPDIPPDGGYGWVCVACVFLINGHTWGVNSVGHSNPFPPTQAVNSY